jgi:hypothetical protein
VWDISFSFCFEIILNGYKVIFRTIKYFIVPNLCDSLLLCSYGIADQEGTHSLNSFELQTGGACHSDRKYLRRKRQAEEGFNIVHHYAVDMTRASSTGRSQFGIWPKGFTDKEH